ncbi:endonuclease/exonuclease/phosphatase family protein [Haliea sp. E1-2-M8]|uniref:endonuclease/exonuclease/phosphatase family protein n=1 Tax=Haliea sp. E1-2-M8 TaxID=3064706 RepID=UPI00271899A1|nr:endonuclease/exonuclease/phosphatase family protein [Haliea sp. E1-2-M8]MDO8863768.1 endonuclease/exonuclease/phosphatase family protein [Haliea sp. E1-2-M8]
MLASAGYWLALHVPLPQALQPLVTLADLLPRWLVFLPTCLLLLGRRGPARLAVYAALTLLNVFLVLDLKLHMVGTNGANSVLRVGSYNTGGGRVDVSRLLDWFESHQLDVLLLQESGGLRLADQALPEHLNPHCHAQLCVLARHPVTPVAHLNRTPLGGYGTYAASYVLSFQGQTLPLVNLHLNTPRHALETQRAPITNYRWFLRLHERQAIESMLASALVPAADRVRAIVAGDFNLTQQSSIYRQYWSEWQNSFSQAGNGLGRTKHTRLLGVRIDHILAGEGLEALSSEVFPPMGGDHRPIVSTFFLR